ncbi:hypothetical protein GCM10023264_24680 [Sphingomonas daechungensis]
MLLGLATTVLVALLWDWSVFWSVGNWQRTFRGTSPSFTYRETMFPRLVATIAGCVLFWFGKQFSEQSIGVALFILAVGLIGTSHGYLYYKAWVMRREGTSGPGK